MQVIDQLGNVVPGVWACDDCGKVFKFDSIFLEKAMEEYRQSFGEEPDADTDILCDECYNFAKGLTPEGEEVLQ